MALSPVDKIAQALSMSPPAQGIANQMAEPAAVPAPQASALKLPSSQQAKVPAAPKAPTLNANSRVMPVLNQTARKTLSTSTSQLGPTKLGELAFAEDAMRSGPVSKLAQLISAHPANPVASGGVQPPPAVNPNADPGAKPGVIPKKRAIPASFDRALSSNRVATGLAKMPSKAQAVQPGPDQFKQAVLTKLGRQDTDLSYGAAQMPRKPILATASPSKYPKTYAATRVVEDLTGFPTASATFTPSGNKAVNQSAYSMDQTAFKNTRNAMQSGGPLSKLKALSRDPRTYAAVGGPAAMMLAMPGAAAGAAGHVATRAVSKLPAAMNLARMGSTIGAGRAAPAAARAAHHAHGGGGLIAAGANAVGSTLGRVSPAARAAAGDAIAQSGRPLGHVANDMLGHEAAAVMSNKGLAPKQQNPAAPPMRRAAPSLPAQNLQRPPSTVAPPAGQVMSPPPATRTPLVRATQPRLVKTSATGDFARKIGLLPPIPRVPGAASIPNTPVVGGSPYATGLARMDLLGPDRLRREWSRSASGIAEPTLSPLDFLLPGAGTAGSLTAKGISSIAGRVASRATSGVSGFARGAAQQALRYGDDLAAKAFPNASRLGAQPALATSRAAGGAPIRMARPGNPISAPLRRSADAGGGAPKGMADDLVPFGRNTPPPPSGPAVVPPKPGLRDRVATSVKNTLGGGAQKPAPAPAPTPRPFSGQPGLQPGAVDKIFNAIKGQVAKPAEVAVPKQPSLLGRGVSAAGKAVVGVPALAGAASVGGGVGHSINAAINAPKGNRAQAAMSAFSPGVERTSREVNRGISEGGRAVGVGAPRVSTNPIRSELAARRRNVDSLF